MKYLGPRAKKVLAYGVASVSGTILAVCSCTVLPLFAGIYRMGAGLGPATAFLYSGPAINVLAIVLTARVLGLRLGVARAVGAILFAVVLGLLMHLIFRREELDKADAQMAMPEPEVTRPLWQNALYFAAMVWVLVFANWGRPEAEAGLWHAIWSGKWALTALGAAALGVILASWFGLKLWKLAAIAVPTLALALATPEHPELPFTVAVLGLSVITSRDQGELGEWFSSSWGFAKQILPLLFAGVLVAGALLGRPGHEGLIPSAWVAAAVGGNSLRGEPLRLGGRGVHVLRHADRGADPRGAPRQRHGSGAGARAAARRSGAQPAQHAGHRQRDRVAKDGRLRLPRGGHGHRLRPDLRTILRMRRTS